jgi:hypothetical protein
MFIRRLPSFEYHAPASIQEASNACLNALARRKFSPAEQISWFR